MKSIRSILLLSFFLFCFNLLWAQDKPQFEHKHYVIGKVIDSTTKGLEGVIIKVDGNNIRTTTDKDGAFMLQLSKGQFILNLNIKGLYQFQQLITVTDSTTTILSPIQLKHSSNYLEEVMIKSRLGSSIADKSSSYVAKMDIANIENPQAYSVISAKVMQEQVIVDYSHALLNAPSVASGGPSGNGQNNMMIRGFSDPGYIRNGLAFPQYADIDPANIERIEIIKGPSATLFGSGALTGLGGLVNRVTKMPKAVKFGEVNLTEGGYNLTRLTLDYNTPLNEDSTALFRINGAIHRQGSFQDYGFAKNTLIAPVFTYKINDRLDIKIDGEYYIRRATSTPIFTISSSAGITNMNQLKNIYTKSFLTNEVYFRSEIRNLSAQLNYKLDVNWRSSFNIVSSHTDYNYPFLTSAIGADSIITRSAGVTKYDLNFMQLQENINGSFNTGSIKHHILLGADYVQRRHYFYSNKSTYDNFNYITTNAPYVNEDQISATIAKLTFSPSKPNSNTYGIYAADVLNVTNHLDVMLSGRFDRYVDHGSANYSQNALSPKLGIVYQIIQDKLSLYGNYMQGFQNVSGTDANGVAFKPQRSKQKEVGLKAQLLKDKLSATLSYYDIKVNNTTRTDPDNTSFKIQDGTQYSRGTEFELTGTPFAGLTVILGYGNNKSRYTQAVASIVGNRPAYVPNNVFNYWISYTLNKGMMRGLGAGFGGNYAGNNYFDDANTILVPSYFVMNGSVFYDTYKYRISLKMDNISDKKYYITSTPQMLRRTMVSFALKF